MHTLTTFRKEIPYGEFDSQKPDNDGNVSTTSKLVIEVPEYDYLDASALGAEVDLRRALFDSP